jgi:hypothetical protein
MNLSHHRKGKLFRHFYVAALAFNILWLVGSILIGLFDKDSFLPSNSLRQLAYAYYGPTYRESRFVGIALQELYDTPTLVTSREILSYLFEVEEIRFHTREVQVQLVDDPARYLAVIPQGEGETYLIGTEGREREVTFVLPDEDAPLSGTVVSVRDGARVLFVRLPSSEE